ncbi:MAG: DapH/DapD/GlmU-related protein [bacterium]
MFANIKYDISSNKGNTKGQMLALSFRIAHFISTNPSIIIRLAGIPIRLIYVVCIRWILGVDLDEKTTVGKGLIIFHGQGLVINSETIIGERVILRQNTTIGNKEKAGKSPVIGDDVNIGANVVIIGDVHIGEKSIIGAGSVITKNVPSRVAVAGNPFKIIKNLE